jgi:hypothetical protein
MFAQRARVTQGWGREHGKLGVPTTRRRRRLPTRELLIALSKDPLVSKEDMAFFTRVLTQTTPQPSGRPSREPRPVARLQPALG